MKYHKFGRRRKPYYYVYDPKSRRKSDYMINTGRSKHVDGIYFENQTWGALHKAWKGYTIAKNKDEYDRMLHYADAIQTLQNDLKLDVSSFPDIGKSALAFHSLQAAQIVQENKNTDNQGQGQQVIENENYQGDSQYEQERFTDTYSEYFEDDENKADRFTDDYHENFTE